MPAPFTDADVLKLAPYGADGVTVTPSASAFGNSAWVEVEAATSTPWVLVGLYAVPSDVNAQDVEVDVGIGPDDPGMSVVGQFSLRTGAAGATVFGHTDHFSPILINRIPLGSRVAVRMRKSGTDTTDWRFKMAYYEGPLSGTFNVTDAQSPARFPPGAVAATVTTPASAWGNSTYADISAALPYSGLILGANIELDGNGQRFEVDLATGIGELVIATLWEFCGNVSEGLQWFPLKTPLRVTAGHRLAFRARDSSSVARAVTCSVLILPDSASPPGGWTERPLRMFPTATALLTLSAGSGVTPGSWVEVWAATTTVIDVAGFAAVLNAAGRADVQLGIGSAGNEVVIASQRVEGNPASQGHNALFPTAIRIGAGERVALRTRIDQVDVGLQYFDTPDADNFTEGLPDTLAVVPISVSAAINGVSVTPGDSWAWGAWVELTAGETDPIGVYGISVDQRRENEELEWEIGIGASPTAIATWGSFTRNASSGRQILQLPGIFRLPASTRVAVRLRSESNGAFGGTHRATLLYYTSVGEVDPPGDTGGTPELGTDPDPGLSLCGGQVIVPWVTVQLDAEEKSYAFGDIALDAVHREARLLNLRATRALSSMEGGIETATASIELSDHDRALRAADEHNTLLNKRVDVYASTKAGIISSSTPRRLFQGRIRRYKPLSGLRFRIELEDFFSALLNQVQGKKFLPQRTFTLDDFPGLPETEVGKSVPIGYGLLSDEHLAEAALGVCPLRYVGQRSVVGFSADASEFVAMGHATMPWQSLFIPTGGGLSTGTAEPSRMKITTSIADVIFPGTTGYATVFGGDLFVDYNGNRYSTCYLLGPRAELAASGQVPLAANIPAIEDVGDGTGNLIESLPLQVLHLLTNFVLQNYASGPWLNIPDAIPGSPTYSCISSSTFQRVHDHMVARMGGSPSQGYLGAFMLGWEGQFHNYRDVVRDCLRSGAFNLGINKDGQIVAEIRGDAAATIDKHWSDVTDIVDGSFDTERRWDDLANRIEYRAAQRYVPPVATLTPDAGQFLPNSIKKDVRDWLYENVGESALSIANHESDVDDGRRPYRPDFPMVRDAATADNVAAQIMNERKDGPIVGMMTVGPCGTDVELGNNHEVTNIEGPLENGWVARLLRVERIDLSLDDLPRMVQFTQRDLQAIAADSALIEDITLSWS